MPDVRAFFSSTAVICSCLLWASLLHAQPQPLLQAPVSNSVGMQLQELPAGQFRMGAGVFEVDVTLTRPFAIATHEVTQRQWIEVMHTQPWREGGDRETIGQKLSPGIAKSNVAIGDDYPAFCQKLTVLERAAGALAADYEYRLPTEAEWEYACRAGTTTTYSFGDDASLLGDYGWFRNNSSGHAEKVGTKKPNSWGLYDVHGNAWEWCSDWFLWPAMTLTGGEDPTGPAAGTFRSLRGGSWWFSAEICQSDTRTMLPSYDFSLFGFRVVRSAVRPPLPPEQQKALPKNLTQGKPQQSATLPRAIPLEAIEITSDVVYGHKDGMALTFDVFQPTKNSKGIGVLYSDTGLWVSMWTPPELKLGFFKPIIDAGYTVFCVHHSSSPRYLVPEMVTDTKLALRAIEGRAAEWSVDPKRLGMFGFSAGGNLSLLLGMTDDEGRPLEGEERSRIAAIAVSFPVTDLRGIGNPENPLRKGIPALRITESQAEACSPILLVRPHVPPMLVVHGTRDRFIPLACSERLRDSLTQTGVENELVVIRDGDHGFDSQGNREMFAAVVRWFDTHLATPAE
jgi:formylglycine-generating enzyme required for sulfatase activity/acetyl esterase/lipase